MSLEQSPAFYCMTVSIIRHASQHFDVSGTDYLLVFGSVIFQQNTNMIVRLFFINSAPIINVVLM